MAHDVFISYSQRDKATADAVCHALETRGLRCWIAPRDEEPGRDWMEGITDAITACRVLVLVFSSAANESRHVAREVALAFGEEVTIIPFRIEAVPPSRSLRYSIGATHWLDALTPPLERHLATLVDKVGALVAAGDGAARATRDERPERDVTALPRPTPASPPVPARSRGIRWVTLGAGIAVLGALAVAASWLSSGPATIDASSPPPVSGATPLDTRLTGRGGDKRRGTDLGDNRGVMLDRVASRFSCSGWYCVASGLGSFTSVRRIHLGEKADQLDQVVELTPAGGDRELAQARTMAIPFRPGASALHLQLEFTDGARSDTKQIPIASGPLRSWGMRVPATRAPRGADAPVLFAAYVLGTANLRLIPSAPAGTDVLLYTFDDGGFMEARPTQGGTTLFELEAPFSMTRIRLAFRRPDGAEIGPFEYALEDGAALVRAAGRASLTDSLNREILCTRVRYEFPVSGGGTLEERNQAGQRTLDVRIALGGAGLTFVTRAPIIACRPNVRNVMMTAHWVSAREVRLGTAPGRLSTVAPVSLTLSDLEAGRLERGPTVEKLWHATLPATADAVYAQVLFRDGSRSREIRVPLDEIGPSR